MFSLSMLLSIFKRFCLCILVGGIQKHIIKSMYFNFEQVNETLIPYTKVTAVHHQTLSKKKENWEIIISNLNLRNLQGLVLLFVDKQNDLANENEKF